jgi:hypothetical protein
MSNVQSWSGTVAVLQCRLSQPHLGTVCANHSMKGYHLHYWSQHWIRQSLRGWRGLLRHVEACRGLCCAAVEEGCGVVDASR